MTLKARSCAAMVALLVGSATLLMGCPRIIPVKDDNLVTAIRRELGSPFGFYLTQTELAQVEALDARNLKISNLSGIEYCQNLAWLDLSGNALIDIGPLEQLGNPASPQQSPLTYLNLSGNQILDITPLAGLLNLHYLDLTGNPITDLQPLVTNNRNGGIGNTTGGTGAAEDVVVIDTTSLTSDAQKADLAWLSSHGVRIGPAAGTTTTTTTTS